MRRDHEHWSSLPSAGRWFLAGTFASNVGNGMQTLAAGALLYQETGTIAAFGAVVVVEQAATVLMQVIAGPAVDNGDPRRMAMFAEAARGVGVCALTVVLAGQPNHALNSIVAMTLVIRVLHTFHRAGTFALMPALVSSDGLARFNSWYSACQQGGQLVGLGVTGLVIARWGAPLAFYINGVTFLLSAATLSAIASAHTTATVATRAPRRSLWREVIAAWAEFGRLLRKAPALAGLIVVSTADNVALILFNLMLAPLVAERFAADPTWLSLLAGGFAFGALAASATPVQLSHRLGAGNSVLLGLAGQVLCFAALWAIDMPLPMLVLAVALGAFNTISWTLAVTLVQLAAPAEVRGRLAMVRNAVTAIIAAPLVPLVALIAQLHSNAASLLLVSVVCAIFLLIAGVTVTRPDSDPNTAGNRPPVKRRMT